MLWDANGRPGLAVRAQHPDIAFHWGHSGVGTVHWQMCCTDARKQYWPLLSIAIVLSASWSTVRQCWNSCIQDLPELLMDMKKNFAKDIPWGVLAAVAQKDVLLVAWQDNNLVLGLTTAYGV